MFEKYKKAKTFLKNQNASFQCIHQVFRLTLEAGRYAFTYNLDRAPLAVRDERECCVRLFVDKQQ